MKLKKLISAIIVLSLCTAGCVNRKDSSQSSVPELSESEPSSVVEPKNSDLDESISSPSSQESSDEEEGREDKSVPTMTEIEEVIKDWDSQKRTWGPGTQVDSENRPIGCVDLQSSYGNLGAYFVAPNTSNVYLTFDEGYENGYTAQILDTLKEKNVKAVFFITYPYARTETELVTRMVDEGHVIGNHSTKHLSFPDMSIEEAIDDVNKLHEYVKANFGYAMTLFRPPMGDFSEKTIVALKSIGYTSVFWSFAYRDWEVDNQPISIQALDKVASAAHPGAIFLLHAVSSTNAEILGDVIDDVKAKGFNFARFDWV